MKVNIILFYVGNIKMNKNNEKIRFKNFFVFYRILILIQRSRYNTLNVIIEVNNHLLFMYKYYIYINIFKDN